MEENKIEDWLRDHNDPNIHIRVELQSELAHYKSELEETKSHLANNRSLLDDANKTIEKLEEDVKELEDALKETQSELNDMEYDKDVFVCCKVDKHFNVNNVQ